MSPSSNPINETRRLADAMFDGDIDAHGVQQLEHLIVNDQACLQAYLEMVNLHGQLLHHAASQTEEQAAVSVLRDFVSACDRRERRNRFRGTAVAVASVILFCGLVGWLSFTTIFQPTPIGSIAHLTNDAQIRSGDMQLGHVVRKGKSISISTGVVSIQLPHALIDLIGPAELKLDDLKQVQLNQGTLTARVSPGGEGLTVRTADAEVVDLGTEFSVQYDAQAGTNVAVRRGRARASLLDTHGMPTTIVELTASRAAHLSQSQSVLRETAFEPRQFEKVDRARGGIRSITGQLRTAAETPLSLTSEDTTTPNHMLVIPERQHVTLQQDLVIETITGKSTLPAGSIVSSYLVHYDPTATAAFAPRGAITFFDQIAALIVGTDSLNATDTVFGLPETQFDTRDFRGLERTADEIQISDDRQTVSFFFGVSPPAYLDQVRILVLTE